ncbi:MULTISPECIES: DUF1499 domain-containing protein [Rhizobium]|uniref:DUF1499 domain-containing protein n=1 Tax=Rhizobium rhododendri TaxID=2506430 RepID=A0ABY8IK03_9HYPH|nr:MULTISPECIES: DUF1499 domain-containing protein [Rhizobium]MBZ5761114.1 DUF1499 domain-containing protein [Rhizobium sp. VS19-DR96]MBZ5767198.1 DUF1499 domain-containing protein [Rhizobium sp. VS19-DR129.2]MBZ5773513.1 DUF1499 domain-containing protein [Rhizobium sp. VS19-DRK62.2]MBZ5785510.1 DUF1499 domain-containing protein [Rhizobium sp. VS19-DR121]MBZ5802331.1 DUF1499 domain-containing protein [Rhizobium sp. VS19-DR181]
MTIRFDRPISGAAKAARLVAAFALVLCILALLDHRFGPLTTPYLALFLLVSAALAAVAVLLAVIGLAQLWRTGAVAGVSSMKALVYAALPLALLGLATQRYVTRPQLFDVTTDLANPPAWLAQPRVDALWLSRDARITPATREAQGVAYPELTGRRYEGAMDRVLLAVRKVARQRGIAFVRAEGTEIRDPTIDDLPVKPQRGGPIVMAPDIGPIPMKRPEGVLEGEDPIAALIQRVTDVTLQGETRTKIIGLPLDVVIRLHEEAETTLVDIRIASRYGAHDLGVSAGVAEAYLKALDAELLGIAGN